MSFASRISVGLNVVLIGVVVAQLYRGPFKADAPVAPVVRTAVSIQPQALKTAPVVASLQPRPGGPSLTIEAVAELRKLGVSRDAIVEGLINDHTYRYDQRVRALKKKYAPKPVPPGELREMSWQMESEKTRELKEALGDAEYTAWDKDTTLAQLNMGGVRLDSQEAEKAYRLQKEFDEKNKALRMAKDEGVADEADTQALYNQAQQKLDQELETLLGKDRVAAMRGAPDPIADVTRRFDYLHPTTDQAKAVLSAEADIHSHEAALVQQLKENPSAAVNLTAQLKAENDAREESLRRVFGADNYAALKQQNDSTYQKLTQYAEAWDLKDAQIQPLYATLSAFHDEADRTRTVAEMKAAAGQPVNWHEINAGIDQARQQVEAGLAATIGGERVRRLEKNGLLDVR
jgi:hypothetical protein